MHILLQKKFFQKKFHEKENKFMSNAYITEKKKNFYEKENKSMSYFDKI